jgi:hypothetical protein
LENPSSHEVRSTRQKMMSGGCKWLLLMSCKSVAGGERGGWVQDPISVGAKRAYAN